MRLDPHFGWRDIEGWFDFGELYDRFVDEASPGDSIVEVGTWLGRSTCYLATKAKLSNKDIRVVAVDTYEGSDNEPQHLQRVAMHGGSILKRFLQNMIAAGVMDRITVLPIASTVAANYIEDGSVFAAFIDANHRYEHVLADIRAWYPKVKPGGFLAGHDLAKPDVARAVEDGLAGFGIASFETAPGDSGQWPSWYVRKPV